MKPRPFNFSLAGLLVASFLFPSLALIWYYRDPWQPCQFPQLLNACYLKSPDGRRVVSLLDDHVCILDAAVTPRAPLYQFKEWRSRIALFDVKKFVAPCFVDDDTLIVVRGEPTPATVLAFRRRFPEWWWGHFHRPEVWIAIIFGSIWLYRTFNWFRARRSTSEPRPSGSVHPRHTINPEPPA